MSGFGAATPIEICLGAARVVAPGAASGASGVCVGEGAAARACSGDADCDGIEGCVCGRCVVRACAGDAGACRRGEVCRGRRCTAPCAEDADCGAGQVCLSGGCARPCSGDGACHFGERCDALDGACRAEPCAGEGSCGSGAACEPVEARLEAREPAITAVGGSPVAFVELRAAGVPGAPGAEAAIYRARVAAPRRWIIDPAVPALAPPPGETRVGAPSVIPRGNTIDLFAAVGDGASITRAASTDGGATFALDPSPVLTPAEPWESGRVASPAAIDFAGATWLFYEGGARAGIGLARVEAGAAARAAAAPVLTPAAVEDPLFWRGVTEVGAPHAVADGDVLRLYFTARGAEGGDAVTGGTPVPADRNDSIGLATTRDLASFALYPAGPVFARVTNLRTYLGEREPAVLLSPEGASLSFVATDAGGDKVVGLSAAGP
ncbi:MAG: hypothetical protein IT372_19125 [Polyangiaceae bacterium]|nr:hypothetical protein [Polyangiaceae bacterium]